MSIKIIGAGYGRTATKSLQLALEELGYGKCYHMEELLRNPEGVKYWKNAMDKSKVDWDSLFSEYHSIVDFPGSIYYKELYEHYPEAKVILSIRDADSWYDSVYSTIFSFDPGPALKLKVLFSMPFSVKARNLFKVIMLNNKSIWGKLFEGKFKDKTYAIENYNAHNEEVKKSIPPDMLLIFEAKDGWEPLCNFLGKEIPSIPFPRTNKKDDFHTWAKGLIKEILK